MLIIFIIQIEQYTIHVHIMKPKMSLDDLKGVNINSKWDLIIHLRIFVFKTRGFWVVIQNHILF